MTEAMDRDSPGLEVIKPNLKPKSPTPPPFCHQGQSPKRDSVKLAHKDSHQSKPFSLEVGQSAANVALFQSGLASNNPDVWRYEQENPHYADPPFQPGLNTRELKLSRPIKPSRKPNELESKPAELGIPGELERISRTALLVANRLDEKIPLPPIVDKRPLHPVPVVAKSPGEPRAPPNKLSKLDQSPSSLSKYHITAPESRDSLPALRDLSTPCSPDDSGTRLPPIQTQLNQLGPVLPPPTGPPTRTVRTPSYPPPPVTTVSPPLTRVEPSPREHYRPGPFMPPKIPSSPYPHLSSQAISVVSPPVSQQSYWRSGKPPGSYTYDPPSTASTRSPASNYPTPIDRASTGACESGGFTHSSQGHIPPTTTGTFKCSYVGCTAPPFQTQYLLNSHANVHSQDRPHFCPVDGCSRGPGGKGFKRKNEMIRHGLVHNSPGYVCPFCPDQQHKYPRPDNLQRHVRVHHVDKNKDDPALRRVLAQRPEGSGRGRRRRINSQ